METWPETVPYAPLANSFSAEPYRAPHATEFEDGPYRLRPRSSLLTATLRFTIRMSNTEYGAFALWVRRDLNQGTRPFLMKVWREGAYVVRVCGFRERPTENPGFGLRYRIALVIDVEDQ